MNGKQILKILKKANWEIIRIKGSHYHLRNEAINKNVTIPLHGKKDLKPKTLSSIQKATGVKFK